jgi:hypothetical protein
MILAGTFNNIVGFTSTPCFGIAVEDVGVIDASARRRENATIRFTQSGYHFVYLSENLLYPSENLAVILNHYIAHPESRAELSSGVAIHRIPRILEHHQTGAGMSQL